MLTTRIVKVHGRQVIDSRGNPTIEAVVILGFASNFESADDAIWRS
ncbi:MAG TPA: hypothetical protein VGI85_01290 [Chthoniobacterales bacterium]|jgi:enolase